MDPGADRTACEETMQPSFRRGWRTNRETVPAQAQADKPAPPERGIDFHLDRVSTEEIVGWAVDPADPASNLTVEFAVDGIAVGVVRADRIRADVEKAGRGPRHCGFRWGLPPVVAGAGADGGVTIELRALCGGGSRIPMTRVVVDGQPGIAGAVRDALDSELAAVVDAYTRSALGASERTPERREPGRYPAHQLLFATSATAPDGRASLSPFIDFTHKRLRKEKDFPLDGGEATRNAVLRWYIEEYNVRRRPLRAPLGAAEIAYLNAPVALAGIPYKLSRASLSYALTADAAPSLFPVNTLTAYESFVAWWCLKRAPELNVEDCLIPDYYAEVLRRVPTQYMGAGFGLSVHMLRRFKEDKRYAVLDLSSEDQRMIYHVWLLLEAGVRAPGNIRFMPAANVSALLDGATGQTQFDRVLQSLHESGEAVAEIFDAARYSELLLRNGFDLKRRRFIFTDQPGNRFEAARWAPARARDGERVPLQVIGPFEKSSGLGQATRLSAETIRRTGHKARFVNFGLDNPAPIGMSSASGASDTPVPSRVNIIHLNGETVPIALAYMPDVFDGAYNIGYFFWELSKPAKTQALALGFLDEIWVSTEYGVSVYGSAVDVPVTNVGMAVEPMEDPGRSAGRAALAQRLSVSETTFVFMASFDSFSFLERKNPHGLVDAFRDAFAEDDDVLLVLKTHNRDFVLDRHQAMRWERILEIAAGDPRVAILNETLPYGELMTLKRGVDCYVSLHRSEGWGFGLIEAMALGVPVLCTGYSGNMDFTRAEHAWLVDYDLVSPKVDEYIFVEGDEVWAAPRRDSAVAQLRAVRADHAERERRAERARAFVERNFSLDAQAAKYKARLDTIMASLKG